MSLLRICSKCQEEIKDPVIYSPKYTANGAPRMRKICRPCYNERERKRYTKKYVPLSTLTDEQKKDIMNKIQMGVNLARVARDYNLPYYKILYFKKTKMQN